MTIQNHLNTYIMYIHKYNIKLLSWKNSIFFKIKTSGA